MADRARAAVVKRARAVVEDQLHDRPDQDNGDHHEKNGHAEIHHPSVRLSPDFGQRSPLRAHSPLCRLRTERRQLPACRLVLVAAPAARVPVEAGLGTGSASLGRSSSSTSIELASAWRDGRVVVLPERWHELMVDLGPLGCWFDVPSARFRGGVSVARSRECVARLARRARTPRRSAVRDPALEPADRLLKGVCMERSESTEHGPLSDLVGEGTTRRLLLSSKSSTKATPIRRCPSSGRCRAARGAAA